MANPDFRSLVGYLSRHKRRYLMGVTSLLVTNLGLQVLPYLSGRFINDLISGQLTTPLVWKYAGSILGAAAVVAGFRFLWRYFIFGTARYVEQDLRAALFRHLEKLSASFYHQNKTGDLMAMATNDLQAVRAVGGEGILMSADATFMTLITLGAMANTVGWKLTGLALAPLPLLALLMFLFGRLIFARSRAVQDAFGKLSDVTHENIAGVRVVKAFVQEEAEQRKFHAVSQNYLARFMGMMRINGLIEPSIQLMAGLCFALAIIFTGRAVLRGEIDLGDFVALTMYIGMLIWPMIAMGWVVNIMQRGFAAFARIQGVLDTEPEIKSPPGAMLPEGGSIQGRIEVQNLTFRYGANLAPAVNNVSVTVLPGQTLGILGRTGSGKSTLVSLLARLFDPPRGTIFIDGVDLLDLPLQILREQVAFVPQESFLFSRTVGENIGFAPGAWTREEIAAAARTAQVEKDILEFLPEGYDTMVGERGVTLSGGQRQRVGLSRAVLKNAPILVLDDCLSAVDTSTEARILNGLRPVMAGRTTLVISHRVAAMKAADLIIVMDDGRIVESGTHDELLALSGSYFRTFQRQQLEEAIASVEEDRRMS